MASILVVGNINWFNLRQMHIQPLLQAGHSVTVLSDTKPATPEFTNGITCLTLDKPKLSLKAIVIAAFQLGKMLVKGKALRWQQRARLRFLFNKSLLYIPQVERICEHRFDIVHCHFITRPVCIAMYCAEIKQPIISTIHGSDLYVSSKYSVSDQDFIRRCFLQSATVVVPGYAEKRFASNLGCDENKIRVVPWGINTTFFLPPENPAAQQLLKQKWHLSSEKVILSCRNLEPIYNIASIITAFSHTQLSNHAILVVAGSGSERESLVQLAQQLGIDQKVLFTGKLTHEQLLELYQLSDVYIQNPLSDALPYSMLEALACGLPVVCGEVGNIGQISQLITPNHNGMFFSDNGVLTEQSIIEQLNLALNHSQRKFKADETFHQLVEQNLSAKQHQQKIEHIYNEVKGL